MRPDRRPIIVDLPELYKKKPPASVETEMSLLGSILIDHNQLSEVAQILQGPEDFDKEEHQAIYAAMLGLVERTNSLDLVQIVEELRARKVISGDEETGLLSPEYLIKLAESVPSAVNAVHYAAIVAHLARTRRMAEAGAKLLYAAYHLNTTDPESAYTALDSAQAELFELAERKDERREMGLAELMQIEIDLQEQETRPRGLRTGLRDLDNLTQGLHGGELVLVAARPGIGKTALALSIADAIAAEKNPVGFFSVEMRKSEIARRLISMRSGVDLKYFRSGDRIPNDLYREFIVTCHKLAEMPLWVDDASVLTIAQLRTRARRMMVQRGLSAVFVDYVQLMTAPGNDRENRQIEVSAISRGLKALARELDIPVVALCQINRESAKRADNKPRISDLRESGSLEQDADAIWLLHREEMHHEGDDEWMRSNPQKIGMGEIIVGKQRNGPTGTIEVEYQKSRVRYVNCKNHWEGRAFEARGDLM